VKDEDAYYRHRGRIIAFHRALRIVHTALLSSQISGVVNAVPAPILGGGGGGAGGGMRELVRVLVLRGGLPIPWIAVLNFPLPFPVQARGALVGPPPRGSLR